MSEREAIEATARKARDLHRHYGLAVAVTETHLVRDNRGRPKLLTVQAAAKYAPLTVTPN